MTSQTTQDRIKSLEFCILHIITSLDKLRIAMEDQIEEDYEDLKKTHHDKEWVEKRYAHSKNTLKEQAEALSKALDVLEGTNE
jgi:hypothetical protein